ncbi:hypothetical protein [Cytobacillus firmus]|uniref:Uncharacterized protein n=1 Tax=Cytobacillus firmus TaxID=1399 RepID=A0AA46NZD7_CYTFI|nr:hypothetical protein [Cytobacillus firmus]UYG93167.1 hypothetical protein OD459_12805 [Cytobacillus firmus]
MTEKEREQLSEKMREAGKDSDYQWILAGLLIIVTVGIFTI